MIFPNRLFQIFKSQILQKVASTAEADDLARAVQKRLAVEQEQQQNAHCLRDLPARKLQDDEERLHRQQDAVFRDADNVKPERDELARIHRPDDKHDKIAHARGNGRALHAELRRDEQEVERDIEQRALKKSDTVRRARFWGLFIFVAIPLPGTGAWTGSLIAAMLEMRVKEAFPPIALGVVTAGIIVAVVTYGAASLLF